MEQAAQRRRSARGAYKAGEFETAARQYDLLFADPDSAADPALEAQDRLDHGSALIKCGRPTEGAAAFERAVAVAPTDLRARVKLGQTLARLERHDEAVAQFRTATKIAPEDPDTHAMLGAALRANGRDAEARQSLETALGLDPDHIDARLTLMALNRPRDPVQGDLPVGDFEALDPVMMQERTPMFRPRNTRPGLIVPLPLLVAEAVVIAAAGIWVRSLFP